MTTNLNDLEAILLSAATQRDNHSLIPAPDAVATAGERLTKAIASLISRGLAEQRETSDQTTVHHTEGDLRYGVFITDAGSAAIGVGDVLPSATPPSPPSPPQPTKSAAVLALLQRKEGATITELVAATGWLPHTTRAALTSLRKKGHAIDRGKRDDNSCYRIMAAA